MELVSRLGVDNHYEVSDRSTCTQDNLKQKLTLSHTSGALCIPPTGADLARVEPLFCTLLSGKKNPLT